MTQEAIYYLDPYAKKSDKELTSYATCVIDGYKWQVAKSGRTYCAGKAKKEEK